MRDVSTLRRPGGLFRFRLEGERTCFVPVLDGELAAAFERLREVRWAEPLAESLRADLGRVLLETVADARAFEASVAPLPSAPAPARPRRSAANPRGFEGTKYRPPKAPAPTVVDLRPHLDGGTRQSHLLSRVGLVAVEQSPPSMFQYFGAWLDAHPEATDDLRARYWRLELERDAQLRGQIARFVFCRAPEAALPWLDGLVDLAPAARGAVVEKLLERGAAPPVTPPDGLFEMIAELPEARFGDRLRHLLVVIERGGCLEHAKAGFRLADEHRPDHDFAEDFGSEPGALEAVSAFLASGVHADPWLPMSLWRACGRFEGLATIIRDLDWSALDPATATRIVDLLCCGKDTHWPIEREHVTSWFELVAAVEPPWRERACTSLWLREEILDPGAFRRALPRLLPLIRRVCKSTFGTHAAWYWLAPLCGAPDAAWARIEAAPDASLRRLDRACHQSYAARRLSSGLVELVHAAPDLVAKALHRAPGDLVRVARAFGPLSSPLAQSILRQCNDRPLHSDAPQRWTLRELVNAIDGAGPSTRALVRRRVRRHLAGTERLRPTQIEAARRRILERWCVVRLGDLEQRLYEQIAAPFGRPAEGAAESHALLLRYGTQENRRALTRWLRDRRDPESLPGNRAWLRAHPKVDARRWREGIALTADTEAWGSIRLALEQDPLEVLRLGTYVSSCCGLGGGLEYSAAAVMLDVNKRVVFARTAAGTFVARQILALDEHDRLVAYQPYPYDAPKPLFELFERYADALAAALGLERYRPTDGDDDDLVVCPESRGWWDDGAWSGGSDGDA